eukprot:Amastigsp_a4147_12.p4 type:complete len:110 gc:universal Amastigsp_a4147_12:1068-739(-)
MTMTVTTTATRGKRRPRTSSPKWRRRSGPQRAVTRRRAMAQPSRGRRTPSARGDVGARFRMTTTHKLECAMSMSSTLGATTWRPGTSRRIRPSSRPRASCGSASFASST